MALVLNRTPHRPLAHQESLIADPMDSHLLSKLRGIATSLQQLLATAYCIRHPLQADTPLGWVT